MVSHRNGGAARLAVPSRGGDVTAEVSPPAAATRTDPVLLAAYKSIMEVGLRRTTMAEVARRACISRMTLYRRYSDMNRLLSALLETELTAVVAARRTEVDADAPAASQLAWLVSTATADVAAHPIVDRVLRLDPQELLPLIVDRFGSTQQAALTQLIDLIQAGQHPLGDGSIRSGSRDDMALSILVAAQSFVFSNRAISARDEHGHWVAELGRMLVGYLVAVKPAEPVDLDPQRKGRS